MIPFYKRVHALSADTAVQHEALRAAFRYALRLGDLNALRKAVGREVAATGEYSDLKEYVSGSEYLLERVRAAVVLACRTGKVRLAAIRREVFIGDLRRALAACSPAERDALAEHSVRPIPAKVRDRVMSLVEGTIKSTVRRRLAFVSKGDPAQTAEDLVQELRGEAARLVAVYSHFPPVRADEEVSLRGGEGRLKFQPVSKVVLVERDGMPLGYSLDGDRLSVVSAGSGSVRVVYYHYLKLLNFVRNGVVNHAYRIIDHSTAARRGRMVRISEADEATGKSAVYRLTVDSLDRQLSEEGEGRSLAEVLETDNNIDRPDGEVMTSLRVAGLIRSLGATSPKVLAFIRTAAALEFPPGFEEYLDFQMRGKTPRPADIRRWSMEYFGLTEDDLEPLKEALLKESIGR